MNKWRVRKDEAVSGNDPIAQVQAAIAKLTSDFSKLTSDLPGVIDSKIKPLSDSFEDKLKTVVPPKPENKEGQPKLPDDVLAQIHGQGRKIEELNTALKERDERTAKAEAKAEQSDKSARLNSILRDHELNGQDAASAAFQILESQIKKDEEGKWVGPDGTPLDIWVDKQLHEKHTYFLKAKEVAGAGAQGGARRKETQVQIEDIKQGMSPETRAAAWARVSELARSNFS